MHVSVWVKLAILYAPEIVHLYASLIKSDHLETYVTEWSVLMCAILKLISFIFVWLILIHM